MVGIRVNRESRMFLAWAPFCHFVTLKHRPVYNNFKYNEDPNTKLFELSSKQKAEVHFLSLITFPIHKSMC